MQKHCLMGSFFATGLEMGLHRSSSHIDINATLESTKSQTYFPHTRLEPTVIQSPLAQHSQGDLFIIGELRKKHTVCTWTTKLPSSARWFDCIAVANSGAVIPGHGFQGSGLSFLTAAQNCPPKAGLFLAYYLGMYGSAVCTVITGLHFSEQ